MRICAMLTVLVLTLVPAWAHHGKDYLLVETPHIPAKGTYHFFSTLDWVRRGREKSFETVPAFMYALSNRLALELHGHFSDESGRVRLDALAPEVRFQFPSDYRSPWLMGLTVEYEKRLHSHAHNEWQTRFVIGRDGRYSNITFNLIASKELGGGEPVNYGFAVGWRRRLSRWQAVAVELLWGFNGERHREILPGWQFNAGRGLIKLGVGFGLSRQSPDLALRTGYVFSF